MSSEWPCSVRNARMLQGRWCRRATSSSRWTAPILHDTARAEGEQVRERAGVPRERERGGDGDGSSPGQLASDGRRHCDAVRWHARRASPSQAHGHQPAHRRAGARLRAAACAPPRCALPVCLITPAMGPAASPQHGTLRAPSLPSLPGAFETQAEQCPVLYDRVDKSLAAACVLSSALSVACRWHAPAAFCDALTARCAPGAR
jgi:hypothetical protein